MFIIEGILNKRPVYVGKPFIKNDVHWVHDITEANMFETAEEAIMSRFLILTREIDVDEILVKPRAYSVADILNSVPFMYVANIISEEFEIYSSKIDIIIAHRIRDRFRELALDFFKEDFLDEIELRFDTRKNLIIWIIPSYEEYQDDPFLSRIH